MKHIIMLKDDRGQNDGQGEVKDYIAGREYSVGDGLAAAFESTQSCEVLHDPEEANLLGESAEQATARVKAEKKSKLKNK
jgi:hypothetical protein